MFGYYRVKCCVLVGPNVLYGMLLVYSYWNVK